MHAEVKRLQR